MAGKKDGALYIPPFWEIIIIMSLLLLGVIYYIITTEARGLLSWLKLYGPLIGGITVIVLSGRSFELHEDYFAVYWFGIRIKKVPWEQVACVVLVKKHLYPKADSYLSNSRTIYVAIKPADDFPFYPGYLLRYYLENPLRVWRIRYRYGKGEEKEICDAFYKFFGEIEERQY